MIWADAGVTQTEWSKYLGNPVLDTGVNGTWDDAHAFYGTVIFDGAEYKMWYNGNDGTHPGQRVGYATSMDGIVWQRYHGNPVFAPGASGAWDDTDVSTPAVVFDGTEYKMWYNGNSDGSPYKIGFATSANGVLWQRYSDKPVLVPGENGSWDDSGVADPSVILDGGGYKMWYAGYDGLGWRIGYATSSDGVVWKKHPSSPVLDIGMSGAWDDDFVLRPGVVFDGIEYRMWYSGYNGSTVRIGYATSPDGVVWGKYPGNPVLNVGSTGAWDDDHVTRASVLFDDTVYKMWYTGYDGLHFRMGYAVSPAEEIVAGLTVDTEQSVNTGDSFSAAINIEAVRNLAGFQFDVVFDPTVLEVVSVEEGTFLSATGSTYWLPPNIDNATGVIADIACAKTGSGGATGTGTLASITFRAVGGGESDIRLQNIKLSSPMGETIPATSTDANVTIIPALPAWDVDNDGVVDIDDLVLIGQHFGETITTPVDPNPDVNGDGKVDILDFILVAKYFGGVYTVGE